MKKHIKLYIIIFSALVLAIIGFLIYTSIINSKKTAALDILVAPNGTTLKLNGKGIKVGKHKVRPGKYTLSVSKKGFNSESLEVEIKDKENRFVGTILQPNSDTTANWYNNHRDDARLAESVTAQIGDQYIKDAIANNPLLAELPFIGPSFEYRIDYGSSQQNSQWPAINIWTDPNVEDARQAALGWIRQRGFDPEKMEIIYYLKGDEGD